MKDKFRGVVDVAVLSRADTERLRKWLNNPTGDSFIALEFRYYKHGLCVRFEVPNIGVIGASKHARRAVQ